MTAKKFKKRNVLNIPGHAHAMTFGCLHGKPFFKSARAREYFAAAIAQAKALHGFHLWAYVVMPEHVHILGCFLRADYSAAAFQKSLKQSVARRALIYLRKHNPDGLSALATGVKRPPYRFWQDGGGYDRNIYTTKACLATMRYLHENPVRRDLVERPEDWEFSSAADWQGIRRGPIAIETDLCPVT